MDIKIWFMQAWAMDPGQRILNVHGISQQIADHTDHDVSSCILGGSGSVIRSGAALVCVARSE